MIPAISKAVEDQPAMTSMKVFREFIKRTQTSDGNEIIDANGVVSRECYDLWMNTRKILPPNPEKAFQRSLSAHVTGVDGRVPFTPQEEEAVLKVLRRKERWPCFEASSTRFGLMGFRAKGFHEKNGETSSSVSESESTRKKAKADDSILDEDASETSAGPTYSAPGRLLTLAAPNNSIVTARPVAQLQEVPNLVLTDGSLAFLETAHTLLNRFNATGSDAWGTILSMGRMVLVSQGWTEQPELGDASRVLQEYCERYPGVPVVVVDPVSRQTNGRIMVLSSTAQAYLGSVTQNKDIVSKSDWWTMLTTVFAAAKNPGHEVVAKLNISCTDGVVRPALTSFTMLLKERLLVVRGIPLA